MLFNNAFNPQSSLRVLKDSCQLYRLAWVFDHSLTPLFALFMSIWGEIEIEGGAFLIGTNQFLLVIANTVVSISCSVWLQLLFILSCGREDKPCLSGGGTTSSQNPSSSQLSSSSQSNIKGGTYRLTNKRSKPGLSSRFET